MAKENRTVTCPACGQKNRIEMHKLKGTPRCGKCKATLRLSTPGGRPVTVTDATWANTVLHASTPVLVDFWAPWCGPCKMVAPVLEELAKDLAGKLTIAKINTDENRTIPGEFGIRSIPTLILFQGGQVVDRMAGARPKADMLAWLKERGVGA